MKTSFFSLLLAMLVLFSCSKTKIINTEYTSVTIDKLEYSPEKDGEGFSWPKFSSNNKELEQVLNDSLSMKAVIGSSYGEIKDAMQESIKEMGMPQGTVSTSYRVNMNDGFLLDIEFNEVTLGAHHYYGSYHRRVNLQTGGPLYFQDLVKPELYPEIIKKCDEQIKIQAEKHLLALKVEEGVELKDEVGEVEFTEYSLKNFTLTKNNLVFNSSLGLPEYARAYETTLGCSFNYAENEHFFIPDGLLGQYIAKNRESISAKDNDKQTESTEAEYVLVKTIPELKRELNNVTGGTTIVLENDIIAESGFTLSRGNITLSGNKLKNTMLYTEDPEATVLTLNNCENVTIKNLKMRHITGHQTCFSGVIHLSNCKNITIENCDISGCGAYGITTDEDCQKIKILKNRIYDCTYSAMELYGKNIEIVGNTFYRNGGGDKGYTVSEDALPGLHEKDNKFHGWDYKYLMKEVDSYKSQNEPISNEYSNNWGTGNAQAWYRDQELIYMEVEWSEIDAFDMKVYFASGEPQVISWNLQYGETDAPPDGEEYEPEYYNYRLIYEKYDFHSFTEALNESNEKEILDGDYIYKTNNRVREFIKKWITLIEGDEFGGELVVKDVFENMPIFYNVPSNNEP